MHIVRFGCSEEMWVWVDGLTDDEVEQLADLSLELVDLGLLDFCHFILVLRWCNTL